MRYRTPGDESYIAALGRLVWNLLYLEEGVIRWLWLIAPEVGLSEWRAKTAGPKGDALLQAAETAHLPNDLLDRLRAWHEGYGRLVAKRRNAVMHAHPFTTATGGQALRSTNRHAVETQLAETPEQLHQIASEVEEVMIGLTELEPRLQAYLDARSL